jgi:hypothetical protein
MKLPKRYTRAKRKQIRQAILQGRVSIESIKFKGATNSHFLKPPDPEICCGTVQEVADLMSERKIETA